MVLRAKKQLILVKIIDFTPLVPQKLSVESSIHDNIHQKKDSKYTYLWHQFKIKSKSPLKFETIESLSNFPQIKNKHCS